MDRVYKLEYTSDAEVTFEEVDLVNKSARRVVMRGDAAKDVAKKIGDAIGIGILIACTLAGIGLTIGLASPASEIKGSKSKKEVKSKP